MAAPCGRYTAQRIQVCRENRNVHGNIIQNDTYCPAYCRRAQAAYDTYAQTVSCIEHNCKCQYIAISVESAQYYYRKSGSSQQGGQKEKFRIGISTVLQLPQEVGLIEVFPEPLRYYNSRNGACDKANNTCKYCQLVFTDKKFHGSCGVIQPGFTYSHTLSYGR